MSKPIEAYEINGRYVSKGYMESMRKKLPFGGAATPGARPPEPDAHATIDGLRASKRIRQSSKPLLNKLETEFYETIKNRYPNYPPVRPQSIRLKIGCGAWYKGDFFVASWPQEGGPAMPTVFECKGPKEGKNVARGILTIKVAAHQYPEIAFYLIWKGDDGQWMEQKILA